MHVARRLVCTLRLFNGLAERDHGPQSGWVYSVNGVQPNYTSDAYVLHDGDSVIWTYVNAVN